MSLVDLDSLDRYVQLNYNVLFEGRHGVGKTAMITDVFNRAKLRWRYYSASTLDPWVDFIGVPKEQMENGRPVLGMVRPREIEMDEIDAIFFDEFNRAPDKILNAVMELIQFKSINGHKLKNLKVIWVAINPEDEQDTYTVNHLDPAHLDRFHVKIKIPYKLDEDYFQKKYPTTGDIFVSWWKDLPEELRNYVSPRRLDYAAEAYQNKCKLEDFLPEEVNPKRLRTLLKDLPFQDKLRQVNGDAEALAFTKSQNNTFKLMELVKINNVAAQDFFLKYGHVLPRDLMEPFADVFAAKKAGLEVVHSFEELIDKISPEGERGSPETGALINCIDLARLYKGGGTMAADIRDIWIKDKRKIVKLANRVVDTVFACKPGVLRQVFWGLGKGHDDGAPTNFNKITKAIGEVANAAYSPSQKTQVNSKLYTNGIVTEQNFIG